MQKNMYWVLVGMLASVSGVLGLDVMVNMAGNCTKVAVNTGESLVTASFATDLDWTMFSPTVAVEYLSLHAATDPMVREITDTVLGAMEEQFTKWVVMKKDD